MPNDQDTDRTKKIEGASLDRARRALLAAIEQLVTLEVATIVGEPVGGARAATVRGGAQDQGQGATATPGGASAGPAATAAGQELAGKIEIRTKIDLLQGDITSVIPTDFFLDENRPLREFHLKQVEEARAIISGNIKILTDAFKALGG